MNKMRIRCTSCIADCTTRMKIPNRFLALLHKSQGSTGNVVYLLFLFFLVGGGGHSKDFKDEIEAFGRRLLNEYLKKNPVSSKLDNSIELLQPISSSSCLIFFGERGGGKGKNFRMLVRISLGTGDLVIEACGVLDCGWRSSVALVGVAGRKSMKFKVVFLNV